MDFNLILFFLLSIFLQTSVALPAISERSVDLFPQASEFFEEQFWKNHKSSSKYCILLELLNYILPTVLPKVSY